MFWLSPHEGLAWEPLGREYAKAPVRRSRGRARVELRPSKRPQPQRGGGRRMHGVREALQPPGRASRPNPVKRPPRLAGRPSPAPPAIGGPPVSMRPTHWILAITLASVAAPPSHARGLSFTTNYSEGVQRIESCSDIEMRFWRDDWDRSDIVTARRSQTLSLGANALKSLKVEGT